MTSPAQVRSDYLLDLVLHDEEKRVPFYDEMPHQVPPDDDWDFWLLEAGRGTGKTAAAAHYVRDHLNSPPCISEQLPHRVALIAPTKGDGAESADQNDQALTRLELGAKFKTTRGGSWVDWPNGSQVRVFGAYSLEDVDRLRAGGNRCLVWAEELASWRKIEEAWDLMEFGLRLGPHPRIVGTTTPKPRPEYVEIRAQADHIAHAETGDNPHLNEDRKKRLYEKYGDTSIGVQELLGKLIEEAEGAIWTLDSIEVDRRPDLLDEPEGHDEWKTPIVRTVVGLDPPGGATEAGIVAAAKLRDCPCEGSRQPHFAVLDDRSGKLSPEGWGGRAVATFHDWEGDKVLGESNYGGDMVESTIRNVDPTVPYKAVRASRGKRIRAEPIFALYEQHRVHHVGVFEDLEAEMVLWVPDESDWSPNRLDALVWALTELSAGRTLEGDMML